MEVSKATCRIIEHLLARMPRTFLNSLARQIWIRHTVIMIIIRRRMKSKKAAVTCSVTWTNYGTLPSRLVQYPHAIPCATQFKMMSALTTIMNMSMRLLSVFEITFCDVTSFANLRYIVLKIQCDIKYPELLTVLSIDQPAFSGCP